VGGFGEARALIALHPNPEKTKGIVVMKLQFCTLFMFSGLLACSVYVSAQTSPTPVLAPLPAEDRAALINELRLLAEDDSGWFWIQHYEVGVTMTEAQFERLKSARRQALRDAAYLIETYGLPPTTASATEVNRVSASSVVPAFSMRDDRRIVSDRSDLRAAPLPHHRLGQVSGARPPPQHAADSRK
jgi:hypothetical protein